MYSSGRGGAGNFKDRAEEAPLKKLQDFERNPNVTALKGRALESELRDEEERQAASKREDQPYVPSGRGGAGNLHEPSVLREHEATSKADAASHRSKLASKLKAAKPKIMGRGGAGNYVESAESDEDQEEKKRAEALSKRAEDDVEQGLQKPGKAFISPTKESGPGLEEKFS